MAEEIYTFEDAVWDDAPKPLDKEGKLLAAADDANSWLIDNGKDLKAEKLKFNYTSAGYSDDYRQEKLEKISFLADACEYYNAAVAEGRIKDSDVPSFVKVQEQYGEKSAPTPISDFIDPYRIVSEAEFDRIALDYEYTQKFLEMQNELSARATHGEISDEEYREMRVKLTREHELKLAELDKTSQREPDKAEIAKAKAPTVAAAPQAEVVSDAKNTLVVNLFAGPGAGKTTAALELSAELKKRGLDVEYVPEYAKELVRDKNPLLDDQEHVSRTQMSRVERLRGKVDVIVTDSPALLGKIYGDITPDFGKEISAYQKAVPTFNIFIERDADPKKYDPRGRLQTYEQALVKDKAIKDVLTAEGVFFGTYKQSIAPKIADNIIKTFDRINGKTAPALGAEVAATVAHATHVAPSMGGSSSYTQVKRANALANIEANIPAEMRSLPNWCAFNAKPNAAKDGHYDKTIWDCNFQGGKGNTHWAKSNDPATWTTFDKALAYAKQNGADGLTFALTRDARIFCIDLDQCKGADGKYSTLAWEVSKASKGTYAERSVSGKGLHFFGVKGASCDTHPVFNGSMSKQNESGSFELFDGSSARFISVTGSTFVKAKNELVTFDAADNLLAVAQKQLTDKPAPVIAPRRVSSAPSSQSAADVIERIKKSKDRDVFEKLYYQGQVLNNKVDGSPDHSRSDLKLCGIAAFFSGGDANITREIFTTSALFGTNSQRKTASYVDRTVNKALENNTVQIKAPKKFKV